MAYAQASRIPVRMTWSERTALWASARLAQLVAWRIERRHERLELFLARRETAAVLADAREEGLRRALSLGVLR